MSTTFETKIEAMASAQNQKIPQIRSNWNGRDVASLSPLACGVIGAVAGAVLFGVAGALIGGALGVIAGYIISECVFSKPSHQVTPLMQPRQEKTPEQFDLQELSDVPRIVDALMFIEEYKKDTSARAPNRFSSKTGKEFVMTYKHIEKKSAKSRTPDETMIANFGDDARKINAQFKHLYFSQPT